MKLIRNPNDEQLSAWLGTPYEYDFDREWAITTDDDSTCTADNEDDAAFMATSLDRVELFSEDDWPDLDDAALREDRLKYWRDNLMQFLKDHSQLDMGWQKRMVESDKRISIRSTDPKPVCVPPTFKSNTKITIMSSEPQQQRRMRKGG